MSSKRERGEKRKSRIYENSRMIIDDENDGYNRDVGNEYYDERLGMIPQTGIDKRFSMYGTDLNQFPTSSNGKMDFGKMNMQYVANGEIDMPYTSNGNMDMPYASGGKMDMPYASGSKMDMPYGKMEDYGQKLDLFNQKPDEYPNIDAYNNFYSNVPQMQYYQNPPPYNSFNMMNEFNSIMQKPKDFPTCPSPQEKVTQKMPTVAKTGKKKISLEYINKKCKRSVTFSKRKKGIMKKAFELSILTGADVMVMIANETGHVYTYATPKLKPVLKAQEGMITHCIGSSMQAKETPGFKNLQENPDSSFE